jgi:hypothetical protein
MAQLEERGGGDRSLETRGVTMNEKQIRALARKNAAKANKAQQKRQRSYDETLDATRPKADEENSGEADKIFREMKRREF